MSNSFDYWDNRILTFYHEAKDALSGDIPSPRMLILYPTNMCQFNCSFCDYALCGEVGRKSLSTVQWKDIIYQFSQVGESIEFCGGGEPLCHPEIAYMISWAKWNDLKVGILTNGLEIDMDMNPDLFHELCSPNIAYVRFSFEAGSPEMFEIIKGKKTGHLFDKILNNAISLIAHKHTNTDVSYKYTIGKQYLYGDWESAMDIAEDNGFDSIQFKMARNVNNAFNGDVDLAGIRLEEMADDILEHTKLIYDFGMNKLRGDDACFITPIQTTIDYNGDVYLCCYHRHRKETHKIGNIGESDFNAIWGSKRHVEVIRGINIDECNVYDCRFIKYNQKMKEAIEHGHLEFI